MLQQLSVNLTLGTQQATAELHELVSADAQCSLVNAVALPIIISVDIVARVLPSIVNGEQVVTSELGMVGPASLHLKTHGLCPRHDREFARHSDWDHHR